MKKVMIVDDNPISSFMIKMLVDDNEVVELNNTNNIYNDIKRYNPDLLVLDLVMPNESGYDILKRIKQEMKNIMVIIVSSLSSNEAKNKAYDLGADMFISKPFKMNFLKNIIKEKLLYIN